MKSSDWDHGTLNRHGRPRPTGGALRARARPARRSIDLCCGWFRAHELTMLAKKIMDLGQGEIW